MISLRSSAACAESSFAEIEVAGVDVSESAVSAEEAAEEAGSRLGELEGEFAKSMTGGMGDAAIAPVMAVISEDVLEWNGPVEKPSVRVSGCRGRGRGWG